MNFLDILLLVPLLWGLYRGFVKGFIIQLAGIAAFILGVLGAMHFSSFVAEFTEKKFDWHFNHTQLIAFAITFLGIVILVFFLARLMESAVKMAALGIVNKIAGTIFGALKFILITGTLLYLLSVIENRFKLIPDKTQQESVLYKYYMMGIKTAVPAIKNLRS
ncbi:MAG: CvpA family protein [Bacteroidetes bacterium]|nr:CvpA family protein [Bacteroidota bacterium]